MPALENPKHEAFAQQLARGKPVSKAYRIAGFLPNRGNASRLKAHESIRARTAEIKEAQHSAANEANSEGRSPTTGQFIVGHKGNGGRPRGARSKLAEEFVRDLLDEWQHEHGGRAALKAVRERDPVQFAKLVAGILPAKIDTTIDLNVGLFAEIRDFSEAWKWKLAQQTIGADPDPLLIENEAEGASGE
jgi:hypothetical protein